MRIVAGAEDAVDKFTVISEMASPLRECEQGYPRGSLWPVLRQLLFYGRRRPKKDERRTVFSHTFLSCFRHEPT